jgi:hypothetical protein
MLASGALTPVAAVAVLGIYAAVLAVASGLVLRRDVA